MATAASQSLKIADWRAGVSLPDLAVGRELVIEDPEPVDIEPASELPPPDLTPVLADPPAGTEQIGAAVHLPVPVIKGPIGSPVVFDASSGESPVGFAFESDSGSEFGGAVRADAGTTPARKAPRVVTPRAKADQARMIGRGTVIPAILETVIDSDVSGGGRAVVSTDVLASDGKRMLVPRSSRLIGQYRARQSGGQKSAFVVWTQIVQPDGLKHDVGAAVSRTDDKRFFENFASARQGEPLRVTAVRDLDFAKAK